MYPTYGGMRRGNRNDDTKLIESSILWFSFNKSNVMAVNSSRAGNCKYAAKNVPPGVKIQSFVLSC